MSFINYLKERWLTYIFIVISALFSAAVYKLDRKFTISNSNAAYIGLGLILLFLIFILVDYSIYNSRVKGFKNYCLNNPHSDEDLDLFFYPLDREYANIIHKIAVEYEKFKGDIRTKSCEELEFITRWIHDVKVPISAIRLILESSDGKGSQDFYRKMDTEITSIEEFTQRIFYHIKSSSFHNDYRIAKVDTRKLVRDALKGYSNLFSYKKISISITGENHKVLTDEKWSVYIVSQVISNAIKYTNINGNITINTIRQDNETTIQIHNSGKGILSKDIAQVFNKGYTSCKERSGMKSTGYGMYLSKKLSNMMGHKLTVESKYGEFAQFNLTFIENDTIYKVTKM